MNLCILIGRLGRDPEVKQTNSGKSVCNFSLAPNEKDPRGKGREEIVTWHKIVAWNDTAEQAAKLKKGQLVMAEGRLETSKWTDKAGNDREVLQVLCARLRHLDGRES